MSGVLGYDVDGRPLRAGDVVLLVGVSNPLSLFKRGERLTVGGYLGPVRMLTGTFEAFWPVEDEDYMCSFDSVKKLNSDHLPANESFSEIMQALKAETA